MEGKHIVKRVDLIYPELCYKISGVLFEVFRQVGVGYKENYYQKAISLLLRKYGFSFKEQVAVPLIFEGQKIGINFLDFLIEEKIILEIKKGNYFNKQNIDQVNQYLKATNLKLALIAIFTSNGVRIKRIVNIK